MTILIANIGTSDLTIQFDIDGQKYYLPMDFLSEPNLKPQIARLSPELQTIWYNQSKSIQNKLYPELDLPPGEKQRSRDITELLLQDYDRWHDRLSFARILGVLKKASELGAKTAYIFVTDQKSERMPDGHQKDTIFLYQLLAKWLERKKFDLKLECRFIPSDADANQLEPMLDFYEKTLTNIEQQEVFEEPNRDRELVLVSIKGGTGAMITALQLQSINTKFQNLVFIDPELSLLRVLAGESSECKLTIYWRQIYSQKYRTIRQLLTRWDFDGAIQILIDWEKTLQALPKEVTEQVDLPVTLEKLQSAIATLEVGVCFFNLDRAGAQQVIDQNSSLNRFKTLEALEAEYSAWLNLYEQCRIYWELNQVANSLARMSSFWEESICVLIIGLGGERYFVEDLTDWKLDKKSVESQLWDLFAKKERKKNSQFKDWDFDHKPYPLFSRFSKQRFAEAMIKFQNQDITVWQSIKDSLSKKLNYWVECRNDLIHRAEGVSKATMQAMLDSDRAANKTEAKSACEPDEILSEMVNIRSQIFKLLEQSDNDFQNEDFYYIYTEIKHQVLTDLQFDSK